MEITGIANSITHLKGYTSIVPILEGYSSDGKYIVEKGHKRFLLRTFKIAEFERKSEEFSALEMMIARGVKCSSPIEIGILKENSMAYMLLSFIDGIDGEKSVLKLNTREQYTLGIEAGVELRKINSVEAPPTSPDWNQRKLAKHERYLSKYWDGDIRIEHDKKIERFIEENILLMRGRPNRFQHDDFHIRNLVINGNELAGVIDFGRFDWGDPIHEFLKVGQFSSQVSIPFSVGQIHGYFQGYEPDDDFWSLYSLYLAMAVFSSVVWTKNVCPDEMPEMEKILERMIKDHEGFREIKPSWYTSFTQPK